MIQKKFKELCNQESDIWEHLPTLKKYAEQCDHVTEMGVRWVVSTWALLAAEPKKMVSYDLHYHPNIEEVKKVCANFEFVVANVLDVEIEETDLLFIDTWHCGHQLEKELALHADKARKYLIFHDTATFGSRGEDGGEGLNKPIGEFLASHHEWTTEKVFTNNNGLTILRRVSVPSLEEETASVADSEHEFKFGEQKFDKPKNIKFIIPFPDVPYYCWQVLVQIANFSRYGYDVDAHFLAGCFFGNISPQVQSMIDSTDIKSHIHVYHDSRTPREQEYRASLKPWLMAQYFKEFPEEKDSIYVYLDADAIFLNDIDWTQFAEDDIWYESDTCSYLNVKYIKSKGEGLLEEMCEAAGIDPAIVVANDDNCGGAQYVLKNNTAELWDKVWKQSVELFHRMRDTAKEYTPKGGIPIQYWTAEMWSSNWVPWSMGIETKVDRRLHFNWANHSVSGPKHDILHIAGVPKPDGRNYCKVAYQSSPFRKTIECLKTSISYYYVIEVKRTEELFPDLLWD